MIRRLDHIQIVLNDHNGVSSFRQTAQDFDQLVDIRKVQSCGRLIQDIDRLSGTALAEFCGKLDTLCFSSRKSGGGLTQADIGKPYIIQGLDLLRIDGTFSKNVSASSTVIFNTS